MTLIPANLRGLVTERAGDRCEYCHLAQEFQVGTFPVDHIRPVSLAGSTEPDNLALACPSCNARKWKHIEMTDTDTGQVVPLFNPRLQPWSDHFRWSSSDATAVEPTSVTGRATLALLDLNSSQHLVIRSLLKSLGRHPPANDVAS